MSSDEPMDVLRDALMAGWCFGIRTVLMCVRHSKVNTIMKRQCDTGDGEHLSFTKNSAAAFVSV